MATGLDIAAGALGIVGVAQQLTASLFEIRAFCQDVANAPAELQETIASLENMARILMKLGEEDPEEMRACLVGDVLRGSMELCQSAVERIAALALELKAQMGKRRRWGAVRMVVKKKEMRNLFAKLDRSKVELHLAHSMYTAVKQQRDLAKIAKYMEDQVTISYTQVRSTDRVAAISHAGDEYPHRRKVCTKPLRNVKEPAQRMVLRFSLPRWLCQYAWDMAFVRASGMWTAKWKTYRVLPYYGRVWTLCKAGRVDKIGRLLDQHRLCIHDRFEDGDNMFEVSSTPIISAEFRQAEEAQIAVQFRQIDLARFLVERGVEPVFEAVTETHDFVHLGELCPPGLGMRPDFSDSDPFALPRQFAQLLGKHWDGGSDSDIGHCMTHISLATFEKDSASWTGADCLYVLASAPSHLRRAVLLNTLDYANLDATFFTAKVPHYHTRALHVIADSIAEALDARRQPEDISFWFVLLRRATEAGADMHATNSAFESPWMLFLRRLEDLFTCRTYSFVTELLQSAVHIWAKMLAEAGIDLQHYAQEEWRIERRFENTIWQRLGERGVMKIQFGPTPYDWSVWFRHPGDMYAGIFWEGIESTVQSIPGSWVEEESDDYADFAFERWVIRDSWQRSYKCGVRRRRLRRMSAKAKARTLTSLQEAELCDLKILVDQAAEPCTLGLKRWMTTSFWDMQKLADAMNIPPYRWMNDPY